MKVVPVLYNSILRCKHIQDGGIRYELPAHYTGKLRNYFLYYRPDPVVHHHTKQKKFTLPHPEIILVGDSFTHHCISIGLEGKKPKNMYININLPPKEHSSGHEWEDLELDVRVNIKDQGFQVSVVDVDELIASTVLTAAHRALAWQEVSMIIEKIKLKQFPFGDHLKEIISFGTKI